MNALPSPSLALLFPLLLACLLSLACNQEWQWTCTTSEDCPPGQFCKLGHCDPLRDGPIPYDDQRHAPGGASHIPDAFDGDADDWHDWEAWDEAPPEEPHPCPDATPAAPGNLILNEIFAYVPTGPEGDANGDGVRHAHDDEFLELVNPTDDTLDLTGVQLFNDTTLRHTFPPFCLPPLNAVVVFGGIEPGATLPSGPTWTSFAADSRFAYANSAGRAVVRAPDGTLLDEVTYGSHPPVSLTRYPDIFGDTFVPHTDLDPDAIFSPGLFLISSD